MKKNFTKTFFQQYIYNLVPTPAAAPRRLPSHACTSQQLFILFLQLFYACLSCFEMLSLHY